MPLKCINVWVDCFLCNTVTVPAWPVAAAAWRDLCSYFIRNIICSAPGSQQQAARVQDTTVELQTKVFEDYAKLYTAATLALLTLHSLQGSIDDFSINLFEATLLPIWKMWERAFACFTVPVLNCNISCKCRNACEREWLYQLWAAAVRHCANVKS